MSVWIAALVASIVTIIVTGPLKSLLGRHGRFDVPTARSSHDTPTVRGAGIGVGVSIVAAIVVTQLLGSAFGLAMAVAGCVAAATILGAVEDARGLPITARLGLQLVIGIGLGVVLMTAFETPLWVVATAAVVVMSFINIANFMDGVNAISGLYAVVVGLVLVGTALIAGEAWVAIVGAAIAAAFFWFLPWNLFGTGLFLGDSGSYALGAAVAASGLGLAISGITVLPLVGSCVVYLADTGWTLLSRIVSGARWYESHRSHRYHRLEDSGLTHVTIALIVAGFSAVGGGVGFLAALGDTVVLVAALFGLAALAVFYLALPGLVRGRDTRPDQRAVVVFAATVQESLVYLTGLPEGLARDGWDVHVVSNPGPRLDELESAEVHTHRLRMARNISPARDLIGLVHWLCLLRRLRPSVVSAATPKASLLAMTAARALRVPVRRYVLYGLRLETASGPGRFLLLAAERWTMRCATDIEAVGTGLSELAKTLRLGPPEGLEVVGFGSVGGVDTDRFRPVAEGDADAEALNSLRGRWAIDSHRPVVGYVGRITEDKGLRELIAALEVVARARPDIQVLIVGNPEGESGQDLLEAFHKLPVDVVFTGYVDDTSDLLRLMTALVLPSKREGLSTVILEASATALPVVVTDATGARDAVADGETGIVVPVGDIAALAAATLRVLNAPDASRRLGTAGRTMVLERFREQDVTERLIARFDIWRSSLSAAALGRRR